MKSCNELSNACVSRTSGTRVDYTSRIRSMENSSIHRNHQLAKVGLPASGSSRRHWLQLEGIRRVASTERPGFSNVTASSMPA